MGPPGTSDEVGGRTDVLVEETTKLASRVAHTISEGTLIEAVEESIGDQLDGSRNRLRSVTELDRTKMTIRSTPKTRPIAGGLRSDWRGVGRDVARVGPSRAPGPAIDTGGGDCGNNHMRSMPDLFGQIRTCDASPRNASLSAPTPTCTRRISRCAGRLPTRARERRSTDRSTSPSPPR